MDLIKSYIALKTLVMHQMRRVFRIWVQTILPPIITTSLYFIIFGKLIGSQLQPINHVPYIQFIVPGLIMLSVINNAYSHVVSDVFMMRFLRSIEEILVSPMPNILILIGFIMGGLLRAIITAVIIFGVAFCFTRVTIAHLGFAILVIFLAAILLSLAGMINGLIAKKFDDISIIPTFILTPLTYLGGVFYSIYTLPTVWREIAFFNPVLYIINAFRYSMMGSADLPIGYSIEIISGFIVLLFFIVLTMLKRGVGIRT